MTTTKALATTAKVEQAGRIKAAGITIECKGENDSAIAPKINGANQLGEAATVIFTGCKTVSEVCQISSETIATVPISVSLTLDGTLAIREAITPKTKTTFTTLLYVGAMCAVAGVEPIEGKVSALAPDAQREATFQLTKVAVTEASGELKIGSSGAALEGSSLGNLASRESWSFL